MNKLATFASVAILAAAAGQATATVYSIAGTNSGGVSYAENTMAGQLLPGGGITAEWDASNPSGVPTYIGTQHDALVNFSGASVVVYVTGGTYDDQTETGSWDLVIDLTGFGSGQKALVITGQTFTLSADGTTGVLNQIGTPGNGTCVGDFGGCLGLAPGFQGPFQNLFGAVGAGAQSFAFTSANLGGDVPFAVTLTAPEIPVPAAAWLFGSALIGLAGVGRRRAA